MSVSEEEKSNIDNEIVYDHIIGFSLIIFALSIPTTIFFLIYLLFF